jgi:hypothetical protein
MHNEKPHIEHLEPSLFPLLLHDSLPTLVDHRLPFCCEQLKRRSNCLCTVLGAGILACHGDFSAYSTEFPKTSFGCVLDSDINHPFFNNLTTANNFRGRHITGDFVYVRWVSKPRIYSNYLLYEISEYLGRI